MLKSINGLVFCFLIPFVCVSQRSSFGLELVPSKHFLDSGTKKFVSASQSTGLAMNILYAYDVKNRVQLVFGLGTSYNFYKTKDFWPLYPSDHLGNGSADPFSSFVRIDINALSLCPILAFKFKYTDSENHLYNRIGFQHSFDVWSNSKIKPCPSGDCTGFESSLKAVTQSSLNKLFFGIGFEKRLSAKLKINIEPRISYSFNNFFGDNSDNIFLRVPDKTKIIEAGLSMGILFR